MTYEDTELKPCPFCGCIDIKYDNCDSGSGEWLYCTECGATIKIPYNSAEVLYELWNKRAVTDI